MPDATLDDEYDKCFSCKDVVLKTHLEQLYVPELEHAEWFCLPCIDNGKAPH